MSKYIFLPKIFSFSHKYCVYLMEYLENFIVYGEREEVFSVRVNLDSEEDQKSLPSLQGDLIWDWLEEKGYNDKMGELLLKTIFPALLADFCQFVSEALSCSERARLTVSYSLLRKPLKENLAHLEWLLGDPETLLNTLHNEPVSKLAIHLLTQRERMIPIIEKAIERTTFSYIHDAEMIYDLRYNKSAEYGFEKLWNQAVHLITTHKELATEPQNLNFVFSDDEARLTQWRHFYSRLPLLLFYTVEICESLMLLILGDIMPDGFEKMYHRSLGFILWVNELQYFPQFPEDVIDVNRFVSDLEFTCPICDQSLKTPIKVISRLFNRKKAKCTECRKIIRLGDYTVEGISA